MDFILFSSIVGRSNWFFKISLLKILLIISIFYIKENQQNGYVDYIFNGKQKTIAFPDDKGAENKMQLTQLIVFIILDKSLFHLLKKDKVKIIHERESLKRLGGICDNIPKVHHDKHQLMCSSDTISKHKFKRFITFPDKSLQCFHLRCHRHVSILSSAA